MARGRHSHDERTRGPTAAFPGRKAHRATVGIPSKRHQLQASFNPTEIRRKVLGELHLPHSSCRHCECFRIFASAPGVHKPLARGAAGRLCCSYDGSVQDLRRCRCASDLLRRLRASSAPHSGDRGVRAGVGAPPALHEIPIRHPPDPWDLLAQATARGQSSIGIRPRKSGSQSTARWRGLDSNS
jgi:hypothetical protein